MKIATAEQMLLCDKLASAEYGISGLELMENAGRGTVAAMVRHFGPLAERKVLIFTGSGNNGGDGLVVARLLLEHDALPQVVSLAPFEKLQGDAARNLELARQLAIPIFPCLGEDDLPLVEGLLAKSGLLVDAIFGTGLRRPLTGVIAAAINLINVSPLPVVAVDIPSGLDADTGLSQGLSVRAQLTCTYGLPKFAQVESPGREQIGLLEVVDIGIPAEVVERVGVTVVWLERTSVQGLLPERGLAAHKGTFGHLLALAGSLKNFIHMYAPHAAREDTVLFPAFRGLVPAAEYAKLGEKFEEKEHELFGEDGFGKMVERVAAIEKALGIYDLKRFTPRQEGR